MVTRGGASSTSRRSIDAMFRSSSLSTDSPLFSTGDVRSTGGNRRRTAHHTKETMFARPYSNRRAATIAARRRERSGIGCGSTSCKDWCYRKCVPIAAGGTGEHAARGSPSILHGRYPFTRSRSETVIDGREILQRFGVTSTRKVVQCSDTKFRTFVRRFADF